MMLRRYIQVSQSALEREYISSLQTYLYFWEKDTEHDAFWSFDWP